MLVKLWLNRDSIQMTSYVAYMAQRVGPTGCEPPSSIGQAAPSFLNSINGFLRRVEKVAPEQNVVRMLEFSQKG